MARLLVLAVIVVALVACSPEAARARGSGPGADVGNRGPGIEMHGRVDPSFKEPPVGLAIRR